MVVIQRKEFDACNFVFTLLLL